MTTTKPTLLKKYDDVEFKLHKCTSTRNLTKVEPAQNKSQKYPYITEIYLYIKAASGRDIKGHLHPIKNYKRAPLI